MHNLFPSTRSRILLPLAAAAGQSAGKRWFRPEHSFSLLPSIRMEISISEDDDEEGEEEGDPQQRTVLYAAVDRRRTVCPSWHHLSDAIRHKDLTVQSYETMRATFRVVEVEDGGCGEEEEEEDAAAADNASTVPICQVDLHPSRLYRAPSEPPPLYGRLPLNCAVVHYTDGSVRLQPAHHRLLLSGSAGASSSSSSAVREGLPRFPRAGENDGEEEGEDAHRFADKSFRALDWAAVPSGNGGSPSLWDDEAAATDGEEEPPEIGAVGVDAGAVAVVPPDGDRASLDYLARENAALERLLQQQERALKCETDRMLAGSEVLVQLAEELERRQTQTAQLRDAIVRERCETGRLEFLLDAGRIRLVRELSVVYPITTDAAAADHRRRFLIRGLEVPPADLLPAGHRTPSEEEVAAALGMLAHAIHLLGKYLGVHLRHRLRCHGSRSAVLRDDGGGGGAAAPAHPLFPGRSAADREQLLYAVHLLDRNVDGICAALGISAPESSHILAKVKRIYEHITEGY